MRKQLADGNLLLILRRVQKRAQLIPQAQLACLQRAQREHPHHQRLGNRGNVKARLFHGLRFALIRAQPTVRAAKQDALAPPGQQHRRRKRSAFHSRAHGSKKYLIASLDQSLARMGLSYVDLFYHHRPDPETPIEETAEALEQIVRQGKALYIGLSNYSAAQTDAMLAELDRRGLHCLIHQMRYSMLAREPEMGLFATLKHHGVASIAFSPLAQGLLTAKYLGGVPTDSRMSLGHTSLKAQDLTEKRLEQLRLLNQLAAERGQSLAQLALGWALRDGGADTLIVGARNPEQLGDSLQTLSQPALTAEECDRIDRILLD